MGCSMLVNWYPTIERYGFVCFWSEKLGVTSNPWQTSVISGTKPFFFVISQKSDAFRRSCFPLSRLGGERWAARDTICHDMGRMRWPPRSRPKQRWATRSRARRRMWPRCSARFTGLDRLDESVWPRFWVWANIAKLYIYVHIDIYIYIYRYI